MSKEIYKSEYATVNFEGSTQFIELVWNKDVDSNEYRKVFGSILDFSESNKIKTLLSDMRKQGLVRLEDVKWLEKEILTKAVEHHLKRIALVIKESIFSSVYADAIKKKIDKSPIKLEIFDNDTEAKSWLFSE